MSESIKERIIKTLVETYKIRESDLDDAMILQKRRGVGLDKILIEKKLIQEKDLLMLLVKELNIPFINLSKFKIDPTLREAVPERIARQYQVLPLSMLEYTMTIAISDPLNVFVIDDLKNITGKEIDIVMSTSSEITKALDNFYGTGQTVTVKELTKDIDIGDFEIVSDDGGGEGSEMTVDEGEKAPIIRMVNLILKEALKQRASDIHMEPMLDVLRIRYRVDGILHDILNVPKDNQNAILVRIKIMSRLDITINQAPQDGRFKLKIGGKDVDFRVSILPTTFGQKIVMRILDKTNLSLGLGGLGISEKPFKLIKDSIRKPFGMLLITGPTGSGKSTTLYSIINELNSVDKNIITVEDPVEYMVEGLTQIQARPEIGLTFAEGLRAILRQSPDVVMVGEIRDNETADIAIKAALTGQLVLSTLHTNDAPGALTRLIDMGVEPFLVASSVVLITAQRLCRKICLKCKEPFKISDEILKDVKYVFPSKAEFFKGKGCESCRQSGYLGRVSITEVFEIDDAIRNMLLSGKSSDEIKEFARKERGMRTLFEDAMDKCVAGIITLEEAFRVTGRE